MITKEVREWLYKVENRMYSYNDALEEFVRLSSYLTREEINMLKKKIKESFS